MAKFKDGKIDKLWLLKWQLLTATKGCTRISDLTSKMVFTFRWRLMLKVQGTL